MLKSSTSSYLLGNSKCKTIVQSASSSRRKPDVCMVSNTENKFLKCNDQMSSLWFSALKKLSAWSIYWEGILTSKLLVILPI
jgi:hypothetical protein